MNHPPRSIHFPGPRHEADTPLTAFRGNEYDSEGYGTGIRVAPSAHAYFILRVIYEYSEVCLKH